MRNVIVLTIALILLVFSFSSCEMHYASGTVYKSWHPSGRFSRHWGRERHQNVQRMYWGRHKYGMRPHTHRGHFRY